MREIYLDNAATTPVNQEAARLAMEAMTATYGNPSSVHGKGLEAQLLLEKARGQLAEAFGCLPEEVYFTSGATEANNLAILGAFAAHSRKSDAVVSTMIEHSSVSGPVRRLGELGAQITFVAPEPDGRIDPERLVAAVDGQTSLLSCNLVNSETGAISDIAEISRLAKRKNPKIILHTDAVQGLGKVRFSPRGLGADLLSISGHKLHAPKGIGALYVKKGVRILPICYGGGQEKRLRPGTESVPLACALGFCAGIAVENLEKNLAVFAALRERLLLKAAEIPEICINSPPDGAPNICNISVTGYRSETLIHYLAGRGIFVSGGSACSKGADSHVLTAMKLPRGRIKSALRVSFSPLNTTADIDDFFAALSRGMGELTRSND